MERRVDGSGPSEIYLHDVQFDEGMEHFMEVSY